MTVTTLTPVSPEALRERIAAGEVFVLDVRTPGEFEAEHIAGSYNVPLDTLKEHARDVAERLDGHVVLVCASGARASDAQQRLAAAGFREAAVLSGGIGAYAQAGGDVVRRGSGWAMERQVRMTAGTIALTGAVASQLGSRRFGLIPAAIGAGLTWSAVSNTCAMASVLSKMPWNRPAVERSAADVLGGLPTTSGASGAGRAAAVAPGTAVPSVTGRA